MKLLEFLLSLVFFGSIINGTAQQMCPGQTVEFSCNDNVGVIWQGSAFSGQCNSTNDMIQVLSDGAVIGNVSTCGIFVSNVTELEIVTESPRIVVVVHTNLTFIADASLDGATVQCEDFNPNTPLVVNEVLDIPATATPTLMLNQNSQSTVGVEFVLDDDRCVSSYTVNVTRLEDGITTSVTATSSPVMVENLDLCRYNYNFVGYTISRTGERSENSPSVNLTVDLTVLNNLMVAVNMMDPVIEWSHNVALYLTCVTSYTVASDNPNITGNISDPNVRSLTQNDLSLYGFPNCTGFYLTITPVTPMGLLNSVTTSSPVTLIPSDFPTPMFDTYMFNLNCTTDVISLRINIEDISGSIVETTNYSNIFNNSMSPSTTFTGDYFTIDLPGAEGGDVISVTVTFENGTCMSSNASNYTVPPRTITDVEVLEPMVDSQVVTFTLPLTCYQQDELVIISTAVDTAAGNETDPITIMNNPSGRPGQTQTVMFTNLTPNTNYSFTIRIVLRENNSISAVDPYSGMFMTIPMPTTAPPTTSESTTAMSSTATTSSTTTGSADAPSSNTGAIVGAIVGVLAAVAVVIVIIIVIAVCFWSKKKKSASVTITDHEMGTKPLTDNKPETPTPESIENIDAGEPDVIPAKTEPTDSAALIYADLDIGKSKPKPSTGGGAGAAPPTGGASGGQEEVHYADINFVKGATESASKEEDN